MKNSKSNFHKELELELKKNSISKDRIQMKAYLKDNFEFLGVKSGPRKLALRKTLDSLGMPSDDEFEETIRSLWSSPYREMHYCAQEVIDRKKWWRNKDSIGLLEELIRTNQWWDSIDYIASTLIGSYFDYHVVDKKLILKWNKDDNFWVVRTSILFQLKYKEKTDLALLSSLMIPHLDSSEFFLQKAIGWALRQVSKTNPGFVRGFINEHSLKPVSKREAVKYI